MIHPIWMFALISGFLLLSGLTIFLFAIDVPRFIIFVLLGMTVIYLFGMALYLLVRFLTKQKSGENDADWILYTKDHLNEWYRDKMKFGRDLTLERADEKVGYVKGIPYVIYSIPRRMGQIRLGIVVRCKPLKVENSSIKPAFSSY